MKEIPIAIGTVFVDDDVFEWLKVHKRGVSYMGKYARIVLDGKHTYLHRWIMNTPDDMEVDHKNRNRLDCQRDNMRNAPRKFNQRNVAKCSQKKSSQFKGVSKWKYKDGWRADIKVDRKQTYLGTFATELDAARAYNAKALELHGEYAYLNIIP